MNLSSHKLTTKTFQGILVCVAVTVVLFSVYQSIAFWTPKQWFIFVITGVIGLVLSQYQFRLLKTKGYISPRELIIFWSLIWLGINGGILIAVVSGLGNYNLGLRNKLRWTVDVSLTGLTTLIAGSIFYGFLDNVFNFKKVPIADIPINALVLLAAMTLMGFVYYIFYAGLYSIFLKLEGTYSISQLWKDNAPLGAGFALLSITIVFCSHLLTIFFGLLFGLIVLPVIIFGHLSYTFHIQLLAQKTKEISEASRIHLATVEALATAIDARDQVGRGHVSRTQIYAVGIGKIMNLSDSEIEALNAGALLHDIGKLAVPDHILNKPGRLTPAELEKTKIHAAVGASILEKVDFPYPVVPTVRYHHERWDGTGYPEGLAKEEIPLTARVLAVADAYDTLRGARPYRPAVSKEETQRFMMNEAGKQFDPKIVDTFLQNLQTFESRINNQGLDYSDETDVGSAVDEGIEATGKTSYVEQIKLANREVFTLYELARVFGASISLEETYALFVQKIAELVPYDTCVIYLLGETETVAMAKYVEGKNKESLKNRKVQVGKGATGYALQKRQSLYKVDPGLDFSLYQMEFTEDYTAMATLPLIANERLIGAVSLYSSEIENYEDEHMRLLETVSRIASDAILTALRHAETESKALTDSMTNLPNGRSLQVQFEKEIGRAKRNGSSFQVLMLDLDGFKSINDTFGHKAGDQLLQEISNVMQDQLRDYDFLARYAGDEFVAIIPETNTRAVIELCQRMEKAVREFKLDVGDGKFARVGVSLGAASYPKNGETLDQIIIAADKAMYAVKAKRKARRDKIQSEKLLADKKIREQRQPKPAETLHVQEISIENDFVQILRSSTAEESSLIVELDESHIIRSNRIN